MMDGKGCATSHTQYWHCVISSIAHSSKDDAHKNGMAQYEWVKAPQSTKGSRCASGE